MACCKLLYIETNEKRGTSIRIDSTNDSIFFQTRMDRIIGTLKVEIYRENLQRRRHIPRGSRAEVLSKTTTA